MIILSTGPGFKENFEIPLTITPYVKAMTDGVGITKTGAEAISKRPSVYQTDSIREVRSRAESVLQNTTPQERDGLKRLTQILGQDKPLKDNVPRGFYLNIQV